MSRAAVDDMDESEAISLILPCSPHCCLFFRESSGALHHGNEPLLHAGAGVPHDLPPPPAQTGSAGADPEESHLPQQELLGFAAGSGPSAHEEEENVSDPVIGRPRACCPRGVCGCLETPRALFWKSASVNDIFVCRNINV